MVRTLARRVARLEGTGRGSSGDQSIFCPEVLQETSDEDLQLLRDLCLLERDQVTSAHKAALARYQAAYETARAAR